MLLLVLFLRWWFPSLLPSSLDTLAIAAEMRAKGSLPSSLSLWAVENPLLERDASRLLRKVRLLLWLLLLLPLSCSRGADSNQDGGPLCLCQLVLSALPPP